MGYSQGQAPGTVSRSFAVSFKNETTQEIAEVDIRLRVEIDGRTVYRSNPVAEKVFDNVSCPHTGSLLPMNKSFGSRPVAFEYPSTYWTTRSTDIIEITAIKIYTPAQDLHDAGHLMTWIGGHSSADVIAMYKAHPELLHVHNSRGMTAFMMEFAAGDVPTIQYMAAHGCSWKDTSDGGTTILHMAALHDATHLQLALQHVKNIDVKTRNGHTPLMNAIVFGNSVAVPWLLQHHANPNAVDAVGAPVAFYAIDNGQPLFLDELVKAGANVKFHDKQGAGWLHYAAAKNWYMLDKVHAYGIPVDDRVGKGLTPLMVAAWSGEMDPAMWLLRHGANPNLKDAQGRDCFELSKLSNTLHTDRFFREQVSEAKRG